MHKCVCDCIHRAHAMLFYMTCGNVVYPFMQDLIKFGANFTTAIPSHSCHVYSSRTISSPLPTIDCKGGTANFENLEEFGVYEQYF